MTYVEWKFWFRHLPGVIKWFVLLILVRPVADSFYYLKEISPLLSPIYIIGVGIPALIFWSFQTRGLAQKKSSGLDISFGLFAILLLIQSFLLVIADSSVDMIGNAIQYVTPIFLYFYLRRVFSEPRHLEGILQTFLYSALIPVIMIPYALLFNPNAFSRLSLSRGGGIRFSGGYADVMNYAIYITGAFLILGYFFLQSPGNVRQQRLARRRLLFFLPIGVGGLYAIKHTSSWAVFILLFGLFLLFALTSRKAQPVALILLLVGALGGQVVFEKQLEPLVRKEMRVIEGEDVVERSFNGRMSRWKRYFEIRQDMGFFAKVLGTPLSYLEEPSMRGLAGGVPDPVEKVPIMVSGGMHSDFVRLVFFTGGVGLVLYLLFLAGILRRVPRFRRPRRFLIYGAVLAVVFYSISTNPLLYQSMMNYILPIFAFAAVPPKRARRVVKLRTIGQESEKAVVHG